jgi:hypothetical protein
MFWENLEVLTGGHWDWYSNLRFSWWIIFLFYYTIGLPVLYWNVRRRQANAQKLIPLWTYGVALSFLFM